MAITPADGDIIPAVPYVPQPGDITVAGPYVPSGDDVTTADACVCECGGDDRCARCDALPDTLYLTVEEVSDCGCFSTPQTYPITRVAPGVNLWSYAKDGGNNPVPAPADPQPADCFEPDESCGNPQSFATATFQCGHNVVRCCAFAADFGWSAMDLPGVYDVHDFCGTISSCNGLGVSCESSCDGPSDCGPVVESYGPLFVAWDLPVGDGLCAGDNGNVNSPCQGGVLRITVTE